MAPVRTRLPTISLAQARRTALAAQGFADPRPRSGVVTMRQIDRVVDRVQCVQIDSVNVLTRSQYLPFFARLGPYDQALLDRARDEPLRPGPGRRLVEYWAHMASLIPQHSWPLFAFRMEAFREKERAALADLEHAGLSDAVLGVVAEHGPLTSREVEAHLPHGARRSGQEWGWNWTAVKQCLEALFWTGEVTSAGRTASFERRYAVPSAVVAQHLVAAQEVAREADPQEAVTELLRLALVAHGIGTQLCLADYFRIRGPRVAVGLQQLQDRGLAEPVRVRGWDRPMWRDIDARAPRAVPARALLSPFDSLIWQRERTEALWGMRYRLEIYVPAPRRVHGYYVLPFLLDEALVGRVDLKADRARDCLRVHAVHWESGTDLANAGPALEAELHLMAGWLGLSDVVFAKP